MVLAGDVLGQGKGGVVLEAGVEPARPQGAPGFESGASASSCHSSMKSWAQPGLNRHAPGYEPGVLTD